MNEIKKTDFFLDRIGRGKRGKNVRKNSLHKDSLIGRWAVRGAFDASFAGRGGLCMSFFFAGVAQALAQALPVVLGCESSSETD